MWNKDTTEPHEPQQKEDEFKLLFVYKSNTEVKWDSLKFTLGR